MQRRIYSRKLVQLVVPGQPLQGDFLRDGWMNKKKHGPAEMAGPCELVLEVCGGFNRPI